MKRAFGGRSLLRLACACIALLLVAVTLFADPVICAQCGYENAETSAVCSHCQAALPTFVAQAPPNAKPVSNAPAFLDSSYVEAEVVTGRAYYAHSNVGVAYYFLRNAAALSLVTDPEKSELKSTDLIAEANRYWNTLTKSGTSVSTCPACGGTGKTKSSLVTPRGSIAPYPKTCTKCRGSGKVERLPTVDEIKITLGEALRTYSSIERARHATPMGAAWIPEGWTTNLSLARLVSVIQAVAKPCPDCAGTGRADCKKCGHSGQIKCTNSKCVNGQIPSSSSSSINDSLTRPTATKCPVCEGSGFILCPDCNGKGSTTCKRCGGSGQRDPCNTCHGSGEADCAQCHGTGQFKGADCPACHGLGKVLCPKCAGDGRKT